MRFIAAALLGLITLPTVAQVGSAPVLTRVLEEKTDNIWHRTLLSIDTGQVTLVDGSHGAGVVVYTFPVRVQDGLLSSHVQTFIFSAAWNGTVTNTANFNASTADTYSFSLGTAVAADDATLTSTETNIGGATSTTPFTIDTNSGTTLSTPVSSVLARCDSWCATFPGANAKVAFNFAVAAANNSGDNTFRATGTLEIIWITMGAK